MMLVTSFKCVNPMFLAAIGAQLICYLGIFSTSTGAYQHCFLSGTSKTNTFGLLPIRPWNQNVYTKKITRLFYSKGGNIYPIMNQNYFSLEESFPSGIIPSIAKSVLNRTNTMQDETNPNGEDIVYSKEVLDVIDEGVAFDDIGSSSKTLNSRQGRRRKQINLKAFIQTTFDATEDATSTKMPFFVAILMAFLRLVPPSQILFTFFFTGYLIGLNLLASSSDNYGLNLWKPVLPSLPPQGHIPDIMMNPLGAPLTESVAYHNWLRCGALVGYILPIFAVGFYLHTNQIYLASRAGTSVFIISCQIVTEYASKKLMAPLPLRILIPMVYNAMRIGPLYDWIRLYHHMSLWGKLLSIGNFFYWTSNLFFFLIPIASMRYFRSHFFCVEAEEVVLRE